MLLQNIYGYNCLKIKGVDVEEKDNAIIYVRDNNIAIASGKVELIGEINNEPHAKETKTLDLKKELKTEAKLVANIKENNIVFDTELKYGAKVKESKCIYLSNEDHVILYITPIEDHDK